VNQHQKPPAISSRSRKRKTSKALQAHYETVRRIHLRTLFAEDPARGERLAVEAVGISLDYSKNRVTDETLKLLVQLAEESGLRSRIDAGAFAT
jgi:glucose-6-phosphate isomerase